MSTYKHLYFAFPIAIKLPFDRAVVVMNHLNVVTDRFPDGTSYAWNTMDQVLHLSHASVTRIIENKSVDKGVREVARESLNQILARG